MKRNALLLAFIACCPAVLASLPVSNAIDEDSLLQVHTTEADSQAIRQLGAMMKDQRKEMQAVHAAMEQRQSAMQATIEAQALEIKAQQETIEEMKMKIRGTPECTPGGTVVCNMHS